MVDALQDFRRVIIESWDAVQIDGPLGRGWRRDIAEVFIRLAITLV